jgi:hypothetical protein
MTRLNGYFMFVNVDTIVKTKGVFHHYLAENEIRFKTDV